MQRMLTAAAIVAGVALSTTGLALAQTSTMPQTAAPSTTNPGMTPSNGTANPAGTAGASTMNNPANGMSAANNPANGDAQSPDAIRQAQQQLKSQGLYKGAIDGQMGPETRTALSRYQQQNGLPQNAELDQNTMGRLMGNGSTGAANAGTAGSSMPPSTMNPSRSSAQPGNSSSSYAAPGAGSGGSMATGSPSGTGTMGTGTSGR